MSSASPALSPAETVRLMAEHARDAYRQLATASSEQKNQALKEAAASLRASKSALLAANEKDLAYAKEKQISAALLDRLTLNPERIEAMATGLEAIAGFADPVGRELGAWDGNKNGLRIRKVSVPLGVIGIIYESRPNVTADAGALCLKSGNAAILRGGSESLHSSTAIVECLHQGLKKAGLPLEAIQLVPTREREAVGAMLTATGLIDVIVPRGGLSLTRRVAEESRVPTILHLDGNCHSYIHQAADPDKAIRIVVNAKMRRTGICGATESIVIDESIAVNILPQLTEALIEKGCALCGDDTAQAADARISPAEESDWKTEYLSPKLSVKTVSGLEAAIEHINCYSSHHTDVIISEDEAAQARFAREIDSAIVMINSSSQFADGGEFGMGAEIGISTGRLHARGPVGADQLTTYKYIVSSDGAIRS